MDPRPRVSRETRLLFATVVIAIAALWVLARIRFPERPAPVNPVVPVLTQLAPAPAFSDLAAVVADVQPRALLPFVALSREPDVDPFGSEIPRQAVAGFRIRDDVAVALLGDDGTSGVTADAVPDVIGVDRATGLAAVRVPAASRPTVTFWTPAQLDAPRYLLASVATPNGLSLRPVFVGSLGTAESAIWGARLWTVPQGSGLQPGTFAFTSTGTLAGLVVAPGGAPAILPMPALLASAERLMQQPQRPRGWLGLEVQPLTPELMSATGASAGLVVTWVDPAGPAAGSIQIGDVLETIDSAPLRRGEQWWTARMARLTVGESITLGVRRGSMAQPVRLTAIDRPPPLPALGLTLRRVQGGAEVLHVQAGSAAARGGIRTGDVITFAGDVPAPTPAQIARAFALAGERPFVVGVTRDNAHLVFAVSAR